MNDNNFAEKLKKIVRRKEEAKRNIMHEQKKVL